MGGNNVHEVRGRGVVGDVQWERCDTWAVRGWADGERVGEVFGLGVRG